MNVDNVPYSSVDDDTVVPDHPQPPLQQQLLTHPIQFEQPQSSPEPTEFRILRPGFHVGRRGRLGFRPLRYTKVQKEKAAFLHTFRRLGLPNCSSKVLTRWQRYRMEESRRLEALRHARERTLLRRVANRHRLRILEELRRRRLNEELNILNPNPPLNQLPHHWIP